jgi:uncharacterized protein YgbK (DUF1537 family)
MRDTTLVTYDDSCLTPGAPPLRLGVIADDITGALDTGVQFVEAGLETVLLLDVDPGLPNQNQPGRERPVQVLSTDSRDGDVATAQRRAAQAAERLHRRWLYKKIDSTMRGHVGPEIKAVLRTAGLSRAVVCPAVVGQGRTIREGELWVGGTLLHKSAFGRDPSWPARTSHLGDLLSVPSTHLPLDVARADTETLAKAILEAPTPIVSVDAVETADIARIARAAVLSRCLPCGALGLARAWVQSLIAEGLLRVERSGGIGFAMRGVGTERSAEPVLVVAGSRHPTTRAQLGYTAAARDLVRIEIETQDQGTQAEGWTTLAAALAQGRSVILHSPQQEIERGAERLALGETMACWTQRACREFDLAGLVLTGGETALAVCRAFGAAAIDILGELETGIPWGRLVGGAAPGLRVVTKAGGFGRPDSILHAVDALQKGIKQ